MRPDSRSAGSRPVLAAVLLVSVLAASPLLAPASAGAQTVDGESVTDRLTQLADANAEMYLHPVSSGLGAGLNSGFFETAGSADGIHFRVGLQVSGSLIPEDDDTFRPELPETFTFQGQTYQEPYGDEAGVSTPTAAGEGTGVVLEPEGELREDIVNAGEDPGTYAIAFPDGFEIPAVPVVLGEASLQLPTGTGAMVRFLPEIDVSNEVGPISSLGFGVRQSLTAFLERPPVDVAVAAGYQELALGEAVDASGTSFDLAVSKDLDVITVFAAGGVEDTDVDVEYTLENPTDIPGQPGDSTTVSFTDDGANSGHFTGGVQVDLFVARLSVSYTSSAYDVLQARLSFGN